MKRILTAFLIITIAFAFCGCAKTNINADADVILNFIYEENNISVTLKKDEAKKVIAILDGKTYYSDASGAPSCSFDANISFAVGNQIFAIARDKCNCIQDLNNLKYFDVSQEDINYVHYLFEKYGGYFPCV